MTTKSLRAGLFRAQRHLQGLAQGLIQGRWKISKSGFKQNVSPIRILCRSLQGRPLAGAGNLDFRMVPIIP